MSDGNSDEWDRRERKPRTLSDPSRPVIPTGRPIQVSEIDHLAGALTPSYVIDAANELIVEKWNGISSRFTLTELVDRSMSLYAKTVVSGTINASSKRAELSSKNAFDIEPMFRQQGWKVKYDSPDYTESWPAYYTFTKS